MTASSRQDVEADPAKDEAAPLHPRVKEYLEQHCGPPCYGEQDENGTHLSLIRENLRLAPEQRLLRGDASARDTLKLMEHARRRLQKPSPGVR
jgi:hypothetical protein